MKKLFTSVVMLLLLAIISKNADGQANVLNPADPDVVFTSSNQPAQPAWNNYNIVKWGHTARLGWDPYSKGYRSYYYQGMVFRIKFPKTYQHNVNDGKKYPLFIFFLGRGEAGTIYDNEYQLLHGGDVHAAKVDDGTFDGFLLYGQSTTGNSQDYFSRYSSLIDSLVKYVKVDLDRVIVSGLSAGGQASWEWLTTDSYAKKTCASLPISAASNNYPQYFPSFITVPIWTTNGGLDQAPAAGTVSYVVNAFKTLGGNITQTTYPNLGHGVWDNFWNEPNYWPFLNAQHKANPLVYFQHNQFCPGEAVSAKLAVQPGFNAYQWQKDGLDISGATTYTYTATTYGTYRVRFKRTASSQWSDWSPNPIVISQKQATVSPPIQVSGLNSNVLPAPNGSTTVPLVVPNIYATYEWRRLSDNTLVSSTNTYFAPVGQYKVQVTEQFGCSSNFSGIFTVINANGVNVPDKASNVSAIAQSSSTVQLDWNDNPSPQFNETAFEIYRSTSAGTGYKLIAIKGADILTHLDLNLSADTTYYYVIRAINNNGASTLSTEVNVTTKSDIVKPTSPSNLRVVTATPTTITIAWDAASDDVGVTKYDIYVNGVKSFATNNLTFTVPGLTYQQVYSFVVKARDKSGNISPASNQVSSAAQLSGLSYKYYEGTWNTLPDFQTLTPVSTGISTNVSITPRLHDDFFGFLWEGYIKIPVTGSYTFETNSDDGSKLYIGKYSSTATALVNNDGLHGGQYSSGTITLTAGIYPIAITFFENSGGQSMNVYWRNNVGIPNRTAIPNTAFSDNITIPASSFPVKPANLAVTATSYNKINLSWADNSNNETGFEIVRSTSEFGIYQPIGSTAANISSYIDSTGLAAVTKYWYKVRSINQSGASAYISITEANWSLDNNYVEASGSTRTLTPFGSPNFDATNKKEGTHALNFNGTTAYADMAFSSGGAFPSNAYGTRTFGAWINPTASAISSANKIIIDLGGSDNGLSLRFNSGALQAGISKASIRSTVSLSNIITNTDWVSNGWNHVAGVYDGNTLILFVNGVQKGSTNLSNTSTTIGTSSSLSRIAASNGTNAFNSSSTSTNYGGLIDDIIIITEPLNSAAIKALMTQSYAADTTLSSPAVPPVPSGSVATSLSSSKIKIEWNDNAGNETGFEIQRAVGNTSVFRLIATVAPATGGLMTYIDSNLFANTNYYYKIRALGIGGNSVFTANVPAHTLDNKPVINQVANFSLRYGSQKTITFTATDVDVESLTMSILNLPAFAMFTPGNGTASLQLTPSVSQQGVYPVSVIATDGNGGSDTTTFAITVNSNYTPVINAISNITINEGSNGTFQLTATDQDGNSGLVWSLVSSTPFASFSGTANGVGTLNLQPNYAQAGVYNTIAKVIDGNGGEETITFTITVNDLAPIAEKIYMSMMYTGPGAPAPWNNISSTTTNNLLNSNGQTTPVSIQFLGTPWNGGDAGYVTGNNSGVYPDAVIKDYFWFGNYGAPETVNVQLSGLIASNKYDITLFASSGWFGVPDNGTTVYTVNGVSKSLYVQNNNQNTVSFSSISADQTGKIVIGMSKAADGTPYGLINAIVLQKPFDDGSAPVLPLKLMAAALNDGTVKLSWTDVAYNEDRYLVYRSTSATGPFTVLNPGVLNANDTTYIDSSISSSRTYYYKLEAVNNNGTSGLTDSVLVTTGNKAPFLVVPADLIVKGGSNVVVNITATDDASDILTTSITGLPSFGSYQNTGNGTGNITFSPTVNDIGVYNNINITVSDNFGASISRSFRLLVTDSSMRSVYVNFTSQGGKLQRAPWNNFASFPYANSPLSNLMDDANLNTGFGVRLLSQWDGNLLNGMITGNNNGIYPDDVIESSIFANNTTPHIVQIEGLNPGKRYNIVVFSSHNAGITQALTVVNGSQTLPYEARYNSNKAVQVNGLTPNASGQIQVTLTKNAAATYLNLNAMIIQEYTTTTPLIRPFDLFAEPVLDTNKIKLTWSDRSANETGFEVYRATSTNASYTLITTTAANVTTYTDGTVVPNTRYFYKIRAIINASQISGYSNIATNILANSIVFINFNATVAGNGPLPWNNTNGPSVEGATFSDLYDNKLNNSGAELVITKEFNGPGFAGSTGTGVFPGTVMGSNYWTDAGQLSQVKLNGLNVNKKYRIGCFGSAIFQGYSIATYTCNSQTVYLNSFSNDSKVVYLENMTPNQDGELVIDVRTAAGSPYSFTGAFTIEAYDDINPYQSPASLNRGVSSRPTTLVAKVNTEIDVRVYPNPFTNRIDVEVSNEKASGVSILLYDLSAKLIYQTTEVRQLPGKNKITINLPSALATGTYLVNIVVDGKSAKTLKLIKVK